MSALAGTGHLLRLAMRRDRVLVPVWVVALAFSCAASAGATLDLYPSAASRAEATQGIDDDPSLVALYGPIADVHSAGALATFKLLLLGGLLVAALGAVLVRRHTRLEEESGRAELVAATAVGRHALLAAALTEAALASLAVGVLTAVGNALAGLDLVGSVAFGLAWTGLGLAGAGVAAVCAQIVTSTRAAGGLTAAVLGALYLVRAIGDASAGWLVWLSPFGWASRVDAYADPRWWLLLLPLALLAVCTAAALALTRRRDLGAGLLPDRPGPARGGPALAGVTGLVLREHRTALLGWGTGLLVLGGALGGIAPGLDDLVDSAPARAMLERLGGAGRLVDTFLGAEISVVAVVVTGFAVAAVTHAAGEEDEGRSELVLASGGTRSGLLRAVALVGLAGPALLLLGFGLGASVAYGAQQGGVGPALGRLVPAALAPLPAVWLVAAVGLLLFALRSRYAVLGWVVLAACLALGQVGQLLGLPGWVVALSPYGHVPQLPAESFRVLPEVVLTALAVVCLVLAAAACRRRDVA